VITVLTALIAVAYGLWYTYVPGVPDALMPYEDRRFYAEEQFVQYYSETGSEGGFTGFVWTNNAWLAAQCVMFGITGVFPVIILFSNAQSLGIIGGIMNEFGMLDQFFLYISPHGQLELYSIFVAGAAGLLIFWSWIAPGARTRRQALAEDGRAFFTIVVGLMLALLVSGIIEGFVTRQEWLLWPVRIGIGTAALLLFLAYQWIVGRRAKKAGETGDVADFEAGAKSIVAG